MTSGVALRARQMPIGVAACQPSHAKSTFNAPERLLRLDAKFQELMERINQLGQLLNEADIDTAIETRAPGTQRCGPPLLKLS
jgi:hypothetical protein